MDETLKYTIAVCIGGLLTLLSNYLLENRRLKNERFKFRLEKMINVGEEYYKFSSYSLIYFTSLIDNMNKREEFVSEGALKFLNDNHQMNEKQIEEIRKNNITITTASMYFNVTDSEKAVSHMLLLKDANLKMHHSASIQDIDLYDDACNEYISVIKSIINQIKTDQKTISIKIKELLSANKKVPTE